MADTCQQSPHFPVTTFVQNNLKFCTFTVTLLDAHARHACKTFCQVDTMTQLANRLNTWISRNTDTIRLFNSVTRMRQAIGQIAIVRQHQEPFTEAIEPPDAKKTNIVGYEIYNALPSLGIPVGRDHPRRLVQRQINRTGLSQHNAIQTDLLAVGIDSGPQLSDHLAIHFHATFLDQRLTLPPTADSCRCKHFLQSLTAHPNAVGCYLFSRTTASGGTLCHIVKKIQQEMQYTRL
jgi:hypothetical protein